MKNKLLSFRNFVHNSEIPTKFLNIVPWFWLCYLFYFTILG